MKILEDFINAEYLIVLQIFVCDDKIPTEIYRKI